MRITSPIAKWLYVFTWLVVGLFLNIILGDLELAGTPQNLIGMLYTTIVLIIGMRVFRGRDEPQKPPRAWWRATATIRSSFSLGVLFIFAGAISWAGAIMGWLAPVSPFSNILVIIAYFVVGVFYLHSGWKQQKLKAL